MERMVDFSQYCTVLAEPGHTLPNCYENPRAVRIRLWCKGISLAKVQTRWDKVTNMKLLWMSYVRCPKGGKMGMLGHFDFYIIPVLNPDGYKYSWTTNRMWRKNMRPVGSAGGAAGSPVQATSPWAVAVEPVAAAASAKSARSADKSVDLDPATKQFWGGVFPGKYRGTILVPQPDEMGIGARSVIPDQGSRNLAFAPFWTSLSTMT